MGVEIQGQKHSHHQPIARVGLEVPQTTKNRPPAVELPAGIQAKCLQLIGRNLLRAKDHIADASVWIEPPSGRQQSSLLLKLTIEPHSRERHQMIKGGQKELLLAGEVHAALHQIAVIVVVAENEGPVNGQTMFAKAGQPLGITAAGKVPALAHVAQVGGVE